MTKHVIVFIFCLSPVQLLSTYILIATPYLEVMMHREEDCRFEIHIINILFALGRLVANVRSLQVKDQKQIRIGL